DGPRRRRRGRLPWWGSSGRRCGARPRRPPRSPRPWRPRSPGGRSGRWPPPAAPPGCGPSCAPGPMGSGRPRRTWPHCDTSRRLTTAAVCQLAFSVTGCHNRGMAILTSPSDGRTDEQAYARRWWTLGVLCLSLLIVFGGNSTLNVALPTLSRDLGASESQLQWVVAAYSLVFAGLLFTAGALGDRFGRKGALQFGLARFFLASVLAS